MVNFVPIYGTPSSPSSPLWESFILGPFTPFVLLSLFDSLLSPKRLSALIFIKRKFSRFRLSSPVSFPETFVVSIRVVWMLSYRLLGSIGRSIKDTGLDYVPITFFELFITDELGVLSTV